MNNDLDQVVMDAVDAAAFDEEPVETSETPEANTDLVEASPAAEDSSVEQTATEAEATTTDTQVAAPSKATPEATSTDDDPLKGIPAKSVTGRDNPIPYSRVRKIVAKNTADTTAKVTKEFETKYAPQLKERDDKIADYEGRLTKVGQFEQIMEHQPKEFLGMLSQLPAYKPFFEAVARAIKGEGTGTPEKPATAAPRASGEDPMPKPNRKLADGSEFYDMEGLQTLMDWQARQVEKRVTQQLENRVTERYAPIEQEWQRRAQINQVMPIIERQIAEARTWPLFTDNEQAIIQALQADKNLSLEGAYRKVVVPKLTVARNEQRTQILEEIRRKPATISAPAARTTPRASAQSQPKTGDEVVLAALAEAGIHVAKDRD